MPDHPMDPKLDDHYEKLGEVVEAAPDAKPWTADEAVRQALRECERALDAERAKLAEVTEQLKTERSIRKGAVAAGVAQIQDRKQLMVERDALEERVAEAEERCSSMVSARDLTIRDLKAKLEAKSARAALAERALRWMAEEDRGTLHLANLSDGKFDEALGMHEVEREAIVREANALREIGR